MNDHHDNDVIFHPGHTRLSHTHFSVSCAMNAARGKSGSGSELLPRQQMSVLTVAMDASRVAGMEMEWHQELATYGHGAEVLRHIPKYVLPPTGPESVCLSICLCVSLSKSPWLPVSAVKAKPD